MKQNKTNNNSSSSNEWNESFVFRKTSAVVDFVWNLIFYWSISKDTLYCMCDSVKVVVWAKLINWPKHPEFIRGPFKFWVNAKRAFEFAFAIATWNSKIEWKSTLQKSGNAPTIHSDEFHLFSTEFACIHKPQKHTHTHATSLASCGQSFIFLSSTLQFFPYTCQSVCTH